MYLSVYLVFPSSLSSVSICMNCYNTLYLYYVIHYTLYEYIHIDITLLPLGVCVGGGQLNLEIIE